MSFLTPAKKSLAAGALVLPLTLVACGSDDEKAGDAAAGGSTTAATSTVAAASAAASENTAAPSEGASSAAPAEGSEAPAGQVGAANEAMANPFGNGANPLEGVAPLAPVDGDAASQEDIDGINGLVRGLYQTTTMRQFVKYMPDHTCSAVLSQNPDMTSMDYNQIPDIPMNDLKSMMEASGQDTSQMQGLDWNSVGVESINDVKVKGDDASATVNVTTNQGLDSSVMRFKRENGNWTFCNDAA